MFLIFLAQIPLAVLWFARPILRQCNLQALVVGPVVFLLLLLPLFFPSNAAPPTASNAMPESSYGYASERYQSPNLSSLGY